MTRALRLLALFTALFVVIVRASSFPSAAPCLALAGSGVTQACPASAETPERDTLAAVALDDDSDDDADPAVAPAAPRIRLLGDAQVSAADCGALAAERALPSHAASLERPPRV